MGDRKRLRQIKTNYICWKIYRKKTNNYRTRVLQPYIYPKLYNWNKTQCKSKNNYWNSTNLILIANILIKIQTKNWIIERTLFDFSVFFCFLFDLYGIMIVIGELYISSKLFTSNIHYPLQYCSHLGLIFRLILLLWLIILFDHLGLCNIM